MGPLQAPPSASCSRRWGPSEREVLKAHRMSGLMIHSREEMKKKRSCLTLCTAFSCQNAPGVRALAEPAPWPRAHSRPPVDRDKGLAATCHCVSHLRRPSRLFGELGVSSPPLASGLRLDPLRRRRQEVQVV